MSTIKHVRKGILVKFTIKPQDHARLCRLMQEAGFSSIGLYCKWVALQANPAMENMLRAYIAAKDRLEAYLIEAKPPKK